jgi:hypothetical protein
MEVVYNVVLFALGVYAGMTLMACMVAAGRADRELEQEAAPAGACCNGVCNQGRDCPLREGAA